MEEVIIDIDIMVERMKRKIELAKSYGNSIVISRHECNAILQFIKDHRKEKESIITIYEEE